jgi:16S rRNA (cytidine1402-2'-O)-methyltransferase
MTPPDAPIGRLTLCPTPIGNLEDITLRALTALREADVIACEDTRHTRRLLDRHGIRTALVSFHEHNERDRAQDLLARAQAGERVVVVSDAGMPVISDPGFALVRAAIDADVELDFLPGASAVPLALLASGLPAERWRFVGFLPRRRGELEQLLAGTSETLVAFESPRRLSATLKVLAELDPERPVAVCRELTKLHEEIARGSATQLAERYSAQPVKGELTIVCGAAAPQSMDRREAMSALRELRDAGARTRPAAGVVARLSGLSANDLYRELTSSGQ